MQLLNLLLPTLEENLALEEALLDEAESANEPRETLRVWEWPTDAVILGRASELQREVNLAACEAAAVPVLRRASGGCAVVIGPGCLLFSVVLSYAQRPELQVIDEAHRYVLDCVRRAIAREDVAFQGICDLTWQGRKFSGNSLRCKRTHLLYHGTLLYNFDLRKAAAYLLTPPREPEYRAGREHLEFITNLPVQANLLRQQLPLAFGVTSERDTLPQALLQTFLAEKYQRPEWHRQR
jgi:lipoate-protein ligase A